MKTILKGHSVEPVKLPTEFAEFEPNMKVHKKPYVDCSGCENKNASLNVLRRISDEIRSSPELIWDHWNPQDRNLRKKIAQIHNVEIEQVFITSGAITGIDYCFKIFWKEGMKTGLLKPDWPGFLHYAEFYKSSIKYLENMKFPFIISAEKISKFAKSEEIELMVFANPVPVNGNLIEEKEIEKILSENPGTLFLIDEADTLNPESQAAELTNKYDNVIFLGSLSKYYGLSGLRIGYLISPKSKANHFKNTINPVEVSSLAVLAGNLILEDKNYHKWTKKNVGESIKILEEACKGTSIKLAYSQNCFACYIYSESEDLEKLFEEINIKFLPGQYFGLDASIKGGRINLSDPEKIKIISEKIRAKQ